MEEMNLHVTAQVNRTLARKGHRGRLLNAYEVEAGPVRTQAIHNRVEARAEATRKLQAWLDTWQLPITLHFETVAVVITLMPTDEPGCIGTHEVTTGTDSAGRHFVRTSMSSYDSVEAAKRTQRYRLADAWVDWHDDEQIAKACAWLDEHDPSGQHSQDLRKYAGFQRAAKHAIDNNLADYHTYACEHEKEFAPAG